MHTPGTEHSGHPEHNLELRRRQIEHLISRNDYRSAAYLFPSLLTASESDAAAPQWIEELRTLGNQIQQALQGKLRSPHLAVFHPVVEVRLYPDRAQGFQPEAIRFTVDFLASVVFPYLQAARVLQETHDLIRHCSLSTVRILTIQQDSPLRVKLQGAFDAVRLINEVINPLRTQDNRQITSLVAREYRLRQRARDMDPDGREAHLLATAYQETITDLNRIQMVWISQALSYIEPELTTHEQHHYIKRIQPAIRTLALGDFVFQFI